MGTLGVREAGCIEDKSREGAHAAQAREMRKKEDAQLCPGESAHSTHKQPPGGTP